MPADPVFDTTPTLLLHDEVLAVTRRHVVGETVRISTRTVTREQLLDEALTREIVHIEHVPVGRVVEAAPVVRQEGDVTIIPIVEEVLVVERRLVLKEEIHMRRVRTVEQHRETISLRRQEAEIVRVPPPA